jgi:Uma2 family endonuclease
MIQPIPPLPDPIVYPESDGKPMAENTKQLRWIHTLFGNIAALFREDPDVFVGADQLWYPVEGEPQTRLAPDVYVVFSRPKGDRGSYKQWEEGNVPMTVVFEVLSPSNTKEEMADKFVFYDEHGVEEYYTYDPDSNRLAVYLRQGTVLRTIHPVQNFTSPRLGIRFDLQEPEMVVFLPNGERFLTFEELDREFRVAEQRRLAAEQARAAAEQALATAEQGRAAAEEARGAAEQALAAADQARVAADQARVAAEQARIAAEQRTARLTVLSRKARRQEATPEELAELERLENELSPQT